MATYNSPLPTNLSQSNNLLKLENEHSPFLYQISVFTHLFQNLHIFQLSY